MKLKFKIIFVVSIGIIQFFYSCKKESLKPDVVSEPSLYIRGNFDNDTLDFTAGRNMITASTYSIEVDTFRFFSFQLERKDNWGIPGFEIRFNNFKSPYGNITNDLENTIKPGNYLYSEQGYPPGNPYQYSRITITYYDSTGTVFSSRNPFHNSGSFGVYKTEKYLSNDNKMYLKAFINFNCILSNNKKETKEFKNGKAVIAYEYQ